MAEPTGPAALAGGAAPAPGAALKADGGIDDIAQVHARCAAFRQLFATLRAEIGAVVVGQDMVVEQTLLALLADGHVLLEGVPGLGKTLLVRTLGEALGLPFSRIQFTPDLMPADITGTTVVLEDPATGRRGFTFRPGPLFSQIVLADEINRATPKSQAALLEAMQERSVTVAGQTHRLAAPFLVLATQNPIEQEGTYALPEAQLDRFIFKVVVPYASRQEIHRILERTTARTEQHARPVLDGARIVQAQRLARRVVMAPHVQDRAIRLVVATHPGGELMPPSVRGLVNVGASPRAAQAIVTTAKVRALIDGRYAASFDDIDAVALPALRHRIIRSFEAEADGVTTDEIVRRLLQDVARADGTSVRPQPVAPTQIPSPNP